jgi:hypothetical protein
MGKHEISVPNAIPMRVFDSEFTGAIYQERSSQINIYSMRPGTTLYQRFTVHETVRAAPTPPFPTQGISDGDRPTPNSEPPFKYRMRRRGTRGQISDRAHHPERVVSEQHLGHFKPEGSRGHEFIQRVCRYENVTRESLVALAQVFSAASGIPFPRDFTRRRALVIKWFTDHVDALEPYRAAIRPVVAPIPKNPTRGEDREMPVSLSESPPAPKM